MGKCKKLNWESRIMQCRSERRFNFIKNRALLRYTVFVILFSVYYIESRNETCIVLHSIFFSNTSSLVQPWISFQKGPLLRPKWLKVPVCAVLWVIYCDLMPKVRFICYELQLTKNRVTKIWIFHIFKIFYLKTKLSNLWISTTKVHFL